MAMLQQEFLLLMNGGTLPKNSEHKRRSYAVYLDGLSQKLKSVEQAQALNIGFPVTLKLGDLANVSIEELPSHISHTDTMLSATITGTITDKDVGAVNREVQQVITALPEHEGVDIQSGGIFEQMDETFNKMFIAIIIAIVIVFVIVILMMRSIINPLIIMVSLPLAFIGSIPALLVSGHTLGVSALMGLLMLIGIVLTNAIVLITMVEEQRRAGVAVDEALISGGKTRLRPILMTALTTILAMIPMAIFVSSGTMLSAELAIVVIGGMFSSTLLTLLVIPAIYSLIHRRKQTKSALR
jgi:HAE1 family hydrophobic/amphiphilic exporter-1